MSARCAQHGLRLLPDGGCVMCRADASARRRKQAMGALLVAAGALLGVGVGGPAELSAGEPAARADASRPIAPGADGTGAAPSAEPFMPSFIGADEPGPSAEDAVLAPSLFGESVPQVHGPSPEPPRASTDPEPPRADDPADFQPR